MLTKWMRKMSYILTNINHTFTDEILAERENNNRIAHQIDLGYADSYWNAPCIPKNKCHLITYLYLSTFYLEVIQFTSLLHSFALDDHNSSLAIRDGIYVLKEKIDDILPLNH